MVDTLGLIIELAVHPADIQDRGEAALLFRQIRAKFSRMRVIFADSAYAGQLGDWAKKVFGRILQIVKRPDAAGFVVLAKRRIVERAFSWLGRHRRLAKDYETLPTGREAMIYIAMIHLMLHRLSPG